MQDSLATAFVGRDAELASLAALGQRAAAGRGCVVLIEGEPGIGKSALLEAARIPLAAAGLHIRIGTAAELRQGVPFAGVRSWLNDAGTTSPIDALRSGDRVGDVAATHELAIAEAILDQIDNWCAAGPIALVMDDVHWADRSSLRLLHRLCNLADELPLLLVLAARPLPRDPDFAALSAELLARQAPVLRLGALLDTDTAELVRHLVGAEPGPRLLEKVAEAGGNPLHVTELVAALVRDGAIRVIADTADPAGAAVVSPSASLTEAITQRLDFLPRPSRDVLPMAAALGPTIDVADLAVVLKIPILDAWSAVTEALDGGLLVRVDSELVFRHDLIRHALADRLPASLRSDLLQQAGQALQSTDAPIERVAYYLSVADRELDRASLDWLISVADKLIVRAPELAKRLLSRVATAPDLDPAMRSVLIRLRIHALLWDGNAAEAESVVRAALLAQPEDGDDLELRWLLAQIYQAQARLADAVAVAEEVLSTRELDAENAARFLGMSGLGNFFLERFAAAEQAGRQAVALGESTGNPLATGYGLTAVGAVRYTQGHLDAALHLSARIPALFNDGTGPDQFDPYALYAHCLIELDRLGDAEEVLKTAIGRNRRFRGVYLSSNLVAKARMYLVGGRWDDALAECTASMQTPDVLGYATVAHTVATLIGIRRGTFLPDPDGLPAPDNRPGNIGYAHFHPWVKALTHEARGRPDLALQLLVDTHKRLTDGLAAATLHYIFPDIARLAADIGDAHVARSVAAGADLLRTRQPTASRTGTALLCRGLADSDPDALRTAARAFQQSGRPLFEAQAHENAAVLLAAAGHGPESRTALDTAIDLYSGLGASWDSARAVARVRPYGIRRGVRGPRNRPKSGWAALTDTERKVATQVAEGLSNTDIAAQMFLSRRTIQSHVSNILAKLDLRSRREIATAMPRTH
ncbi:AAA family ATPase [Nocardia vinacea]|uniref:helix-turn-helix transcriptional regulator n=1 Tax=Nocardia vinacea TaxID=96468 RepID=UPI002E13A4AD|nr:AAA family ATPase [Nocardia vinacea]